MEAAMKIEHIAMYVENLEETKRFFEQYFEAKSNNIYHNKTTGFKSYFLAFEDGSRLEIMNKPGLMKKKEMNEMGFIHLAFSVGSEEKVKQLTEELQSAGYEILSGPRVTGDGYFESCIIGIENNLIEITV